MSKPENVFPSKREATGEDEAGRPFDADGSLARRTAFATLEKVAAALDVPPAVFMQDAAAKAEPAGRAMMQALELARLFQQVSDDDARERCIAFVRALVR